MALTEVPQLCSSSSGEIHLGVISTGFCPLVAIYGCPLTADRPLGVIGNAMFAGVAYQHFVGAPTRFDRAGLWGVRRRTRSPTLRRRDRGRTKCTRSALPGGLGTGAGSPFNPPSSQTMLMR